MGINGAEVHADEPFTFERIAWQGEPPLEAQDDWGERVSVTELILAQGGQPEEVVETEYASNLPTTFQCDGVEVGYAPHWDGYSVGGIWLPVPRDAETLAHDVAAVGVYQAAQAQAQALESAAQTSLATYVASRDINANGHAH